MARSVAFTMMKRNDESLSLMLENLNDGEMDNGTIDVFLFPRLYWIVIGIVIAMFSASHLWQNILCRQRSVRDHLLTISRRLADSPADSVL